MSFNIPNIFIAGKKAVAYDVNENFGAIKDEINSQKSSISTLTSTVNTVNSYVNNDLRNELISLIRATRALFCVNSGNKNASGEADLLAIDTVNENRIVFKVADGSIGNLPSLTYSNAKGEQAVRTSLAAIDMTGKSDGTYIVYGKISGAPYVLAGSITKSIVRPAMSANDVWLDISQIPFSAIKYSGTSYLDFNDVPLGEAVVQDGDLTSVTTYPYNQNGYDVNFQTSLDTTSVLMTKILHTAMPDYSSAVSKALGVEHTASSDGYLFFKTELGGNESCSLTIGGKVFAFATTNAFDIQTFIYPIAKGTVYQSSGDNINELSFLSNLV